MNQGQFKDPLCYLCLYGTVVSSLSLMQETVGLSTAIFFTFENKLSLNSKNSQNSVNTFRQNLIYIYTFQLLLSSLYVYLSILDMLMSTKKGLRKVYFYQNCNFDYR